MLPPVYAGSRAIHPTRINLGMVRVGDRIGAWTIADIRSWAERAHGFPCHCRGDHRYDGCSYDDPACPCGEVITRYGFTCRCDCGAVKPVSPGSIECVTSLSCGHCRHRRSPCPHETYGPAYGSLQAYDGPQARGRVA
jgi:hypothetical protein